MLVRVIIVMRVVMRHTVGMRVGRDLFQRCVTVPRFVRMRVRIIAMVVAVTVLFFHFLFVVQVGQLFETELVLHLVDDLIVVLHHLLETWTEFKI